MMNHNEEEINADAAEIHIEIIRRKRKIQFFVGLGFILLCLGGMVVQTIWK